MRKTLEQLQSYFSDYHKDFYGFRPRFATPSQWNDETWLNEQCDIIDTQIARMKETFEGRESLREQGWIIKEADPKLAEQARFLEQERQRFMETEWERIHSTDPLPDPEPWTELHEEDAIAWEKYMDSLNWNS